LVYIKRKILRKTAESRKLHPQAVIARPDRRKFVIPHFIRCDAQLDPSVDIFKRHHCAWNYSLLCIVYGPDERPILGDGGNCAEAETNRDQAYRKVGSHPFLPRKILAWLRSNRGWCIWPLILIRSSGLIQKLQLAHGECACTDCAGCDIVAASL